MTPETTPIRFAHPVDPAVRAQILLELQAIEAHHGVSVLFACESGSRGWGFASPDSDYDVRFIYVNQLSWYLSVDPARDVIEMPISGDLDINGWDLRKALQLLKRSNPTLLEWLQSPIVYCQHEREVAQLRALAEASFSAVRGYHHYVSMAKKNFRGYLQGSEVRYKKYLYVLRPLLAARWVREGRGIPPIRFAELAAAVLDDGALLGDINHLLDIKMRSGESATSPRWDGIHAFIERELDEAANRIIPETAPADDDALNTFLAETILRGCCRQAPEVRTGCPNRACPVR
ncbi:MAG: nucleotidyltransferase domain-containing protein [Burkholderiaceae bacterium]|jgi:predicted nucleotidyltransferase|nr:nucleotidyltransferase domain-containing protein [Burkholderiaceae bacterium]